MNYTSAATGVIMLIAFLTWVTSARKHFSGPEIRGPGIEGILDLEGVDTKREQEGEKEEGKDSSGGSKEGSLVV